MPGVGTKKEDGRRPSRKRTLMLMLGTGGSQR
jgi:hypothetical protein